MELKLNIYNTNGEIDKIYITEDFRLMTGTCEDILEIVEIDKMKNLKAMTDDEALEIMGMMMGLFKQFKPIMKQVFPELTDDEYRRTDMRDVAGIAWQIIQYTIGTLFKASSKN